MVKKKHKPVEIIEKLRKVKVMSCQGASMVEAIRSIGGGGGEVL